MPRLVYHCMHLPLPSLDILLSFRCVLLFQFRWIQYGWLGCIFHSRSGSPAWHFSPEGLPYTFSLHHRWQWRHSFTGFSWHANTFSCKIHFVIVHVIPVTCCSLPEYSKTVSQRRNTTSATTFHLHRRSVFLTLQPEKRRNNRLSSLKKIRGTQP